MRFCRILCDTKQTLNELLSYGGFKFACELTVQEIEVKVSQNWPPYMVYIVHVSQVISTMCALFGEREY